MTKILSKPDYEKQIAQTRDERMEWWRNARFGMFVHYGLYSILGRHEWAMAQENWDIKEYEKLADEFCPKPGAPKEWAKLAKRAGMKYMVLTTRHHEGFSLWDSKVNPYNSVNYGAKIDVVKEFVEACREEDLKIGFYSSLMDWHHPDGWKCAFDSAARKRFTDYIQELNRELMTQYGKIDILWYDVPRPMESWEGWNSLELNQMVRELQPHIIINNRSRLDEDFGTPEGKVDPREGDWEACMTFNDLSWGYVDSNQAAPYSYNAQRIIRMLNTAAGGAGNLLLNIGPTPEGGVPTEAVEPLETVGQWLQKNGEAVYGKKGKSLYGAANRLCGASWNGNNTIYMWNWIWPDGDPLIFGGFKTPLRKASLLNTNESLEFEQDEHRITLKNLPDKSPDKIAGVAVIKLEFEQQPEIRRASRYPQLHSGQKA